MKLIQKILNPVVLLGSIIIAAILIGIAMAWIDSAELPQEDPGAAPAEIAVIPAFTDTPVFIEPPTPEPTATTEIPPSPLPGTFGVGTLVQIAGTGGDGLNLRFEPGLNEQVEYLGFETEVFTIEDGPVENDGFTWWYIVGFSDTTRAGWAAANFLEVIQTP